MVGIGQFQAKRSFGNSGGAAVSNTPAPVYQAPAQPQPQVDQRIQPQVVQPAPTYQAAQPQSAPAETKKGDPPPPHAAGSKNRRLALCLGLAGAGMASCILGGWAGALVGIVPMAAAGLAATSAMEVPGQTGVLITGGLALLGLFHGAMPGGQFMTGVLMSTMGALSGAYLSDQIHDGRLHHYLNDMKAGAADMLPKSVNH